MGIAGFAAAAIFGSVLTLSAAVQTASTSGGPPMRTQAIASPPAMAESSATFSTTEAPAPGTLVDINSASAAELGKVRFIGRKRAAAIVSGRPWRSPDELVAKKIVPPKYYERIKDQLVAR